MNWFQKIANKFATFTSEKSKQIGEEIGIDWSSCEFTVNEFRKGLEIEAEHGPNGPGGSQTDVTGDDPLSFGKIAWAHLLELNDYYTRLIEMEKSAE